MSAEDSPEVRFATLADMPALSDLYRRASLSNDGDRPYLQAHPEVLELSDAAVRAGRTLVAVTSDGIAGFATTLDKVTTIELEGLFVDPAQMRRGVGRALVRAILALDRTQGVGRLEVTANTHALSFYQRVGFVADGPIETRFDPAVRMHLDVKPAAE